MLCLGTAATVGSFPLWERPAVGAWRLRSGTGAQPPSLRGFTEGAGSGCGPHQTILGFVRPVCDDGKVLALREAEAMAAIVSEMSEMSEMSIRIVELHWIARVDLDHVPVSSQRLFQKSRASLVVCRSTVKRSAIPILSQTDSQ